jgi:TolB-like protein/Flp pilus assembly protein TadD
VTDAGKAVFLSYASQDAEAAQRLCKSLRGAGIEVWFDQSELRGGDLWDALIRRQIKGCYLFVPIISANTQSREEGYFRREWKIAVDRTNDMAEDRAFLLPILIDNISDAEARVPEKFRQVQWTRLPGGTNADAFVDHLRRLLSPGDPEPDLTGPGPSVPVKAAGDAAAARSKPAASRSFVPWILGGLLVLVTGWLLTDKLLASKHAAPMTEAPAEAPKQIEAVSDKSIAVLPFTDMSEKKDQEYFSDGLAEELLDLLSQVPELHVAARTSSFSFKGRSEDIQTIARKLLVANVLEGSVRKSGNHLRVTAQLVRADNGYHLWSESYDRDFKDIFKIQDEIAAAVVTALKVSLLMKSAPTSTGAANVEAYNFYLQGRAISRNSNNLADSLNAVDYLQRAVKADPTYAPAWAALAQAQRLRWLWAPHDQREGIREEVLHAVQRALDLNPNLSEAHSALAGYLYDRSDVAGAESQIRKALELDPTNQNALAFAGEFAEFRGQFDSAIAFIQKAINSDPVNPSRYADLTSVLFYAGKYAEALAAERKLTDLNPAFVGSHIFVSGILLAQGDPSAALVENDREPDEKLRLNGNRVEILDALGRKAEADAVLARLERADTDNAYDIACVYALRGEVDQAFKWLGRVPEDQDLMTIFVDPDMKGIHGDPRFKALLKKLHLF